MQSMHLVEGVARIGKVDKGFPYFWLLCAGGAEKGIRTGTRAMVLLVGIVFAGCSSNLSPEDLGVETGYPQVKVTTAGTISSRVAACPPNVSRDAVEYATALHGTAHLGETLYLVVVTEDKCESVVTRRLDELRPYLGDTGSLFIVMASDWFHELVAGRFILAEAHPTATSAQEASEWYAGRTDAAWYWPVVQKVGVMTASPIPVYSVDSY